MAGDTGATMNVAVSVTLQRLLPQAVNSAPRTVEWGLGAPHRLSLKAARGETSSNAVGRNSRTVKSAGVTRHWSLK